MNIKIIIIWLLTCLLTVLQRWKYYYFQVLFSKALLKYKMESSSDIFIWSVLHIHILVTDQLFASFMKTYVWYFTFSQYVNMENTWSGKDIANDLQS